MKKLWGVLMLLLACTWCVAVAESDACECGSTELEWKYDEWHCWQECQKCGYETMPEGHGAYCTDLERCGRCGQTDVNLWTIDHADTTLETNDTHCWYECGDCGETWYGPFAHMANCLETDRCVSCGRDDVIIGTLIHPCDERVWECDDTHCWQVCLECRRSTLSCTGRSEHYAYCDKPDQCSRCGQSDVTFFAVLHKIGADGICSVCGTTTIPGDADNNSSVTLADARAILSGNVSSESNADVNADGKVDQQDVLRIMQYLAGWDVTLQ